MIELQSKRDYVPRQCNGQKYYTHRRRTTYQATYTILYFAFQNWHGLLSCWYTWYTWQLLPNLFLESRYSNHSTYWGTYAYNTKNLNFYYSICINWCIYLNLNMVYFGRNLLHSSFYILLLLLIHTLLMTKMNQQWWWWL